MGHSHRHRCLSRVALRVPRSNVALNCSAGYNVSIVLVSFRKNAIKYFFLTSNNLRGLSFSLLPPSLSPSIRPSLPGDAPHLALVLFPTYMSVNNLKSHTTSTDQIVECVRAGMGGWAFLGLVLGFLGESCLCRLSVLIGAPLESAPTSPGCPRPLSQGPPVNPDSARAAGPSVHGLPCSRPGWEPPS